MFRGTALLNMKIMFNALMGWTAAVVLCVVIVQCWNQVAQHEWLIVECFNTSLI